MTVLPLYINGKFTAQRTTGVQRFATELLLAFDEELDRSAAACRPVVVLLCPPGGQAPPLKHVEIRRIGGMQRSLHAWEQAALPWAARDGWLVSLSGSAPLLHRRSIITIHDAAVFEQAGAYTAAFTVWYRFLFRRLSQRCPLVLTVSEFSRTRIRRWLPIPEGRLVVVPNGGDHLGELASDFAPIEQHGLAGTRYLLAVGSANPTKNLGRLLRAFMALPPQYREVRLVVAGGRNTAVFASEALPDGDRIVFTGNVSDAGLKALYRHALAFVFPSLYEGFGLPPLEAMDCGCPVVAARAAAIPEVCAEAALYFDPLSEDSIRDALCRILEDAALRRTLIDAGRSRIQRYTWRSSARSFSQQLRRVGAFA